MLRLILGLIAVLFPFVFMVQAQDLQAVVNINFVADVRLFTVMSAINAGGFDYETAASMHPVRRQVREKLKSLDPLLLQRTHDFYVAHHATGTPEREIARYTSLALLLSDPPRYEIVLPTKDVPAEAREVVGFEQVLPVFYQQGGLEQLWLEVRPQYLAEIEKYKPVVRQAIAQCLQYLRTEARIALNRQIVFIPDLMSPHGISNSRIVNNLYYLVVSPAEDPAINLRNIRHEYLHFVLDPLIEKNGLAIIQQEEALQLLSERPKLLERFQKDRKLLNTESLIEAIQLRIDRPVNVPDQLAQLYAAGNALVYHYYERLQEFEKTSVSFPENLESMIRAFNLKRELQRKDRLAAETEREREKREQEAQQLREKSERLGALEQANVLLQNKHYVEAEKLLLALKQRNAIDPPVLFGLGQIEMQRQRAAAAESYFKSVITHSQAPAWMVAWSRLYLASLFSAMDRLPEARDLLQQVLQAPGDLKGAREEASRRLARLPAS
ncbi:MAG: hypothetical protein HY644_05805 [Acidobacteria bacterium]|nr:hypothetical protein [Acidobacteriota bacterium]